MSSRSINSNSVNGNELANSVNMQQSQRRRGRGQNPDIQMLKRLFVGLRTAVPEDIRLTLLQGSLEELKFLLVVQLRLSAFGHRRRHSLRHPALSMATKRFYCLRRRQREEMNMAAGSSGGGDDGSYGGGRDRLESSINALLEEYEQAGAQDRYGSSGGGDTSPNSSHGAAGGALRRRSLSFSFSRAGGGGGGGARLGEDGWSDFGMSISTNIWNFRRLSQSAQAATADWGLASGSSTPTRGARGRLQSVSIVDPFGGDSSVSALRHAPGFMGLARADSVVSSGGAGSATPRQFFARRHNNRRESAARQRVRQRLLGGGGGGPRASISDLPMPSSRQLMGRMVMEEADDDTEFINFQHSEDDRWDQLAYCYEQVLRAAQATRRACALAVASDPVVNDVIYRFWDRLTVSPAAQAIHKEQAQGGQVSSSGLGGGGDGDDDVLLRPGSDSITGGGGGSADDGEVASWGVSQLGEVEELLGARTTSRDGSGSGGGGRGAKGSRSSSTASGSGKAKSGGGKNKTRAGGRKGRASVVPAAASQPAPQPPQPPGPAKKAKKAKKKAKQTLPSTATEMTPLQYIYLNTRIAAVLLPSSREVELEMLESAQEDLVMDALYSENDVRQELYFGKAPQMFNKNGTLIPTFPQSLRRRSTVGASGGSVGAGNPRSWRRVSESFGALFGDNFGDSESIAADSVVAHTNDPNYHSSGARGGWGAASPSAGAAGRATGVTWDPRRLPSLTYGQFWNSMMELADNWTFSAGNPTEYAVFLLELYAEVFGHDWDSEDARLVEALKERQSAEAERLAREAEEALESFGDLIDELDEWSSGSDGDFNVSNRNRRKKSKTKRKRTGSKKSSSSAATGGGKKGKESKESKAARARRRQQERLKELLGLGDGEDAEAGWEYIERMDADGKVTRVRRRVVRRRVRRADGTEVEEEYVVEQELDEAGNVLRTKRKQRKPGGKKRKRRGDDEDGDAYHYVNGHRRYFDRPPYQMRRLEDGARRDDYIDAMDDSLSSFGSWSSFTCTSDGSDYDEDGRRLPRRRRRVRRTGTRADRRRYGRDPSFFYGDDEDDDDSLVTVDEWEGEKIVLEGDAEDESGSDGEDEDWKDITALTAEQRQELLDKKEWLQALLAAKGIHIADETFEDPDELVTLYQLLRMTEQAVRRKREAEGDGGSGDDDDDILSFADLNTELLAKLFANPKAYTLDDLQKSELMQMLLALGDEAEDGAARVPLTSAQMDGILAALRKKGPSQVETTSQRLRRERLLREAMELKRTLEEAERKAAAEAAAKAKADKDGGGTFDLTEVDAGDGGEAADGGASEAGGGKKKRPPSGPGLYNPLDRPPEEPGPAGMHHSRPFVPRPPSGSAAGSTRHSTAGGGGGGGWQQDPWAPAPALYPDMLTRAQRREQERLFAEFEAYTYQQASAGGRYQLRFDEYTPEQLEAFFQHLHLGPKDQALLRGRAPLANPSSLLGGNLYQVPKMGQHHTAFQLGAAGAITTAGKARGKEGGMVPAAPAPVKLFTLTTSENVEEAMRESYENYLDDRAYTAFLDYHNNSVFQQQQKQQRQSSANSRTQGGRPPPSSSTALPPLPPSSGSGGRGKDAANNTSASGGATTAGKRSPPPQKSPTAFPKLFKK